MQTNIIGDSDGCQDRDNYEQDSNDECTINDDDDVEDEGELITVDCLLNGYDWSALVTTTKSDVQQMMNVGPDYIPSSGDIKENHIVNRCKYLDLDLSKINKESIKGVLESHQKALRNTIKEWIQRFWVDMCNGLSITFNDGCNVTNFEEFQTAVRQIKNREEARKIAICLYVSFDFCDNFRKKISKCLMKQHGFRLEDRKQTTLKTTVCTKRTPRKKKDCFEKLVSQILTDQRKNINNMSIVTCGYTFTNQRIGCIINNTNESKHRKKKFYHWMVLGERVSIFL